MATRHFGAEEDFPGGGGRGIVSGFGENTGSGGPVFLGVGRTAFSDTIKGGPDIDRTSTE